MARHETQQKISRVSRSKQDAKATYDRISRFFDLLEGTWEQKSIGAGLQRLKCQDAEIVLEIGFGTGKAILAMAESVGESGKVYGIDISPRMIEIARSRIEERALSDRVMLICGYAAQLPFREGSFHAIFMSFTLELFDTPEIPQLLRECKRVLRTGGRVCVVSLSKAGGRNWMRELYEWSHKMLPKLLDCRPIFVQEALEDTGFQIVDRNMMSLWGLPVEIVVGKKESLTMHDFARPLN